MTRPRLVPVLLLKNGLIVRSQGFRIHQVIGNPVSTVERLSHWNVDELCILDIGADDRHDLRRQDLNLSYGGSTTLDVLRAMAEVCFMPLSFGGRIRTLEEIRDRLALGADKVVVNTAAVETPDFISEAARRFGSQCIVVCIDAVRRTDGTYEVRTGGGRTPVPLDPAAWARRAEAMGAGEILLQSIDRDGAGCGYDLDLVRRVVEATTVPVIALGGVGRYEHLPPGILEAGASAVAAANIFHFFEMSYPHAKRTCLEAGIPMRGVGIESRWFPREKPPADPPPPLPVRRYVPRPTPPPPVRWCARCLYPSSSAVPLEFDEEGICTGCRTAEVKRAIPPAEWARRRDLLRAILDRCRSRDGSRPDCVIPVSGGKDSYFQTHVIVKEFGLRPLLVTYNGNNYSEVGWRNLLRMKEVFGVEHVVFRPDVGLLKKLNRLGFLAMGDMNWHNHVGISTYPIRIAVERKVPLLVWGEHGYLEVGGQFSYADFPEFSYRYRLEHFARGYDGSYMVGREGITAEEMRPYLYPDDRSIFDLDVRGIYLGNYLYWEANDHGRMVMERYGFETAAEPFDRTYRTMSNLDDIHENGVHDYMRWIKFGYGRCTDHASKDIRAGLLARDEGIRRVRAMDHVKPRDLARWLDYVGMSEADFDRIADGFRDPRVWRLEGGRWVKDEIEG